MPQQAEGMNTEVFNATERRVCDSSRPERRPRQEGPRAKEDEVRTTAISTKAFVEMREEPSTSLASVH